MQNQNSSKFSSEHNYNLLVTRTDYLHTTDTWGDMFFWGEDPDNIAEMSTDFR